VKAKNKFIKRVVSLAIVCLISVASSVAEGGHKHAKLSPELRSAPPTGDVDVIVQYTTAPTEQHLKKVTAKGAKLKHNLSVIHGAAFKGLPASALAELAADPDVAYIAPDRPLKGSSLDYAPESVNAPWAWQQMALDGKGVGVAVIDSGVTPVGDLYWYDPLTGAYGSRVVYSESFVPGSTDTLDAFGHGTHVAGVIASAGWYSWGSKFFHQFKGIAPNANIINLRALDSTGSGTDSTVIAAIQAAIRLKSQYNIRVINLSLGRPVFESYTVDPLCQAAEAAWKAGIVVVAAAGNDGRDDSANTDGYGTIAAPGNDPYVVTVGAMKTAGTADRADDQIASYSSKGPTSIDHVVKPDLVAPGNKIISTLSPNSILQLQDSSSDVLMGEYAYITDTTSGKGKKIGYSTFTSTTISTDYFRLSGTSMAAPVVSGAAALMLQADPTLTPDTVKARLMKSATKQFPAFSTTTDPSTGKTYTDYYDIFTVGAGYLDIQGALLSTDVVPSDLTAKSPTAAYDSVANDAYVIADASDVWENSVVWGDSVVWGYTVFSGTTADGQSILWDNSVVWGNQDADGFSVVWGDSVVWGIADSEVFSALRGEN
jgi:serine protease AprX